MLLGELLKTVLRAFSLLELIISFGLIATAILLVAGIFSQVLRHGQKSADLAAGTLVGRSVLAEFCYGILNNDTDRTAFFAGTYGPDPWTGQEQQYCYSLTSREVTELDTEPGPADESSRTRLVEIEVYWSNPDRLRAGSGLQRVYLSRLLNEQMAR